MMLYVFCFVGGLVVVAAAPAAAVGGEEKNPPQISFFSTNTQPLSWSALELVCDVLKGRWDILVQVADYRNDHCDFFL